MTSAARALPTPSAPRPPPFPRDELTAASESESTATATSRSADDGKSRQRRRPRVRPRTRCESSCLLRCPPLPTRTPILVCALLCSLSLVGRRCSALSFAGRRASSRAVVGSTAARLSRAALPPHADKRYDEFSSLASSRLRERGWIEHGASHGTNNRSLRDDVRCKSKRLLGRLAQKIRRRLSLKRERAIDDTIGTNQASWRAELGATASRSNGSAIRNNLQDGSAGSFSTASRISRVQCFAKSPLPLAVRSRPTSSRTALHMVLSTPDTIIEQASTQKLLDALLDESVRTQSRQPVMMQFNPKRGWIWRQWRGTVFSETWKSGLANMVLATFVVFLYGLYPSLKDKLEGFSILWGQLLSVTTFTLTFFLNQSYGLWRKCYDYSRRLQGRLNDLGMTLAAHATRTRPSSPDVPSTYTPQSRQALELVSRYVRVFNLLTYASFTRSHRPILTPRGMRRLVERGILTPREREILSDAEVPATQRHNAVLVWLIRLFLEGRETGVFEGGMGFEQQFMEKCHVIRAQYGAIGDELQGRMPLAYAHIVQVLLDVVLWMYPFMALSTGMAWHISIVGTGLLTMFYQGLFDLAKQFLDPYDNENYGKGDDPLVIDTLIAETNAGSIRWLNSFQQQPWNRQLLNDGELYDSLLPLRGYSVEDLEEMRAEEERERKDRELAMKEKKEKQEEKLRQDAEIILMSHVENKVNGTSAEVIKRGNGTAVLTTSGEALMGAADGGFGGNRTFLEVSGGEVTMATLLPPGSVLVEDDTDIGDSTLVDETSSIADEMEINKVLTLADGTLVTPDDTFTADTRAESNATATPQLEDMTENITLPPKDVASSTDSLSKDEATAVEVPPLLDDTNEVSWATLGTTPNFEESIAEMEDFRMSSADEETPSPPLLPLVPLVPLYNTRNDDVISDTRLTNDELENFEWFEEIDSDGQEYRMSQMLADEDWSIYEEDDESEDAAKNKTMTYEEFAQKATEIIERVENELAETKEIMSVSPGGQAEYDVETLDRSSGVALSPMRRKVMDEPEPMYDQTRLDGISQLWGAPPEVLERNPLEEEEASDIINEGQDFRNVYSLWGEDGLPGTDVDEDEGTTSYPAMEGISQLWNDNLAPYKPGSDDDLQDDLMDGSDPSNLSPYAAVEWWDGVSDDGKEFRLSQMLADEVYEEAFEAEVESPMTFEQFAEETEKLIEQAEDERKETEAIMNAPPGANFLEGSEEDGPEDSVIEKGVVASDVFDKMIMSLSEGDGQLDDVEGVAQDEDAPEEIISDEEIVFLEMDDLPEVEEGEQRSNSSLPTEDALSEPITGDKDAN